MRLPVPLSFQNIFKGGDERMDERIRRLTEQMDGWMKRWKGG